MIITNRLKGIGFNLGKKRTMIISKHILNIKFLYKNGNIFDKTF